MEQSDPERLFVAWLERGDRARRLHVRAADYLEEFGIDEETLVRHRIKLYLEAIPQFEHAEQFGSLGQWTELIREAPSTWRLLTRGSEVLALHSYQGRRVRAAQAGLPR